MGGDEVGGGIIPAYAGSTQVSFQSFRLGSGSSPHTRGAQTKVYNFTDGERIIPAYAGSTISRRPRTRSETDHPRIRGEHRRSCQASRESNGSSPHTRGALADCRAEIQEGRIIPAYAGSTMADALDVIETADHPRIRGEHPSEFSGGVGGLGSSPHTRGAREEGADVRVVVRIIPAYAGSTSIVSGATCTISDHPRIRGEHSSRKMTQASRAGSSPHTRGAQKLGNPMGGALGIIPAYAGSTFRNPTSEDVDTGSSPHTRGAHQLQSLRAGNYGIIPAYAGSTDMDILRNRQRRDHPRIRGEHQLGVAHADIVEGSSPHTRGAPESRRLHRRNNGIIPAYAGSTNRMSPVLLRWMDHPRIRGEHRRAPC